MKVNIKVKCLGDRANLPQYQHKNDAGMDVCAIDDHVIFAGDRLQKMLFVSIILG